MSNPATTLSLAGIGPTGRVADAAALRANIFQMTEAAESSVLRPRETGAWPHGLRAALAARIANLNGDGELAARYLADAGGDAALADPACDGTESGLEKVLAVMDKIAAHTRDVSATDIAALQSAGVSDPDIVRLCELNAFLAYQIRVIAGLRLMKEGPS